MKTALAFLIIALSSWFEITVQDPIGRRRAYSRLQSCTTRITQEQGESLGALFSILAHNYAQSKSLGSHSPCNKECMINSVAFIMKLVSALKNCGIDTITDLVMDCVDTDDGTKAAAFAALTGKNLQLSSQTDFNEDVLLLGTTCMLEEVALEDGVTIINTDQHGITMNNVNGAAEALQGSNSLGSADSILSSGNLGLSRPGLVGTVGQIPSQIISSPNGMLTGLASKLLNIKMQLLNQILSLGGLGENLLSGTSSLKQVGNSPLGIVSGLISGGGSSSLLPNLLSLPQTVLGSLGSIGNLVKLPIDILSGLVPGMNLGGTAGSSGIQAGMASDQAGLGSLGVESILNLGNQGLSSVGKLVPTTDILSGLFSGMNLGGSAGRSGVQAGIASDQTDQHGITMNNVNGAAEALQGSSSLGSANSILSSGNLGLSRPGLIGTINQILSQIISSPNGMLTGLASNLLNIPMQLLNPILSFGGFGGNLLSGTSSSMQTDQHGITMNNVNGAAEALQGFNSLGSANSILSSGNLGLSRPGLVGTLGQIPSQIISSPNGMLTGLASNLLNIPMQPLNPTLSLGGLGGNLLSGTSSSKQIGNSPRGIVSGLIPGGGLSSLLAYLSSIPQNDPLGAAVNIVKGAGAVNGNLGRDGLALGGIGLNPNQITSSSSDVISGPTSAVASGATGLASSASKLASGLASGATELASGASGKVAGLPAQVVNIGGNAGLSGILPGPISSDQNDPLGAAVNIVKGAGAVNGNLGLDGLALGGISLNPKQITSSSFDAISGPTSAVASGATGLASSASGLVSGATKLASGASGKVAGLPAQVVNIGGNAGLSGISSDQTKQLGISVNTGAGGLGSGGSISSAGNLGLGSVPTQIITTLSKPISGLLEQVVGGNKLLNGLLSS